MTTVKYINYPEKIKNENAIQKRGDADDESENGEYSIVYRGSKYQSTFRTYIKDRNGTIVSPFHDIPLKQTSRNIGSRHEVKRI